MPIVYQITSILLFTITYLNINIKYIDIKKVYISENGTMCYDMFKSL